MGRIGNPVGFMHLVANANENILEDDVVAGAILCVRVKPAEGVGDFDVDPKHIEL